MKLFNIWERIGKQPLQATRKKDAIVFIGDSEYIIKNIKYDRGRFIGFEAEPKDQTKWIGEETKSRKHKWVIIRDKYGEEYRNHQ